MKNFCGKCGTKLSNNKCPKCEQERKEAKKFQKIQKREARIATENTNQTSPQKNDIPYEKIFVNPNEKFVAALGSSYIKNYFLRGGLKKGFAIVSDKRAYFEGTAYEVAYKDGNRQLTKTNRSRIIDIKDISGSGLNSTENTKLKWARLLGILPLFGIFTGDGGFALICMLLSLIITGIYQYKYQKSKTGFITIQSSGGEIAFDMKWFSQDEINEFQKKLRIAKDQAIETYDNLAAKRMENAFTNATVKAKSAADELLKYAKLLENGYISQEEFNNLKFQLI